jgi:hypothetical protein
VPILLRWLNYLYLSRVRFPVIALVIALAFVVSCKKEKVKGTILLKVWHNNLPLEGATVFLKRGYNINPQLPVSSYDDSQISNAAGQIYFTGLDPDDYYFIGNFISGVTTYTGETSVTVFNREEQNRYEKIIYVN